MIRGAPRSNPTVQIPSGDYPYLEDPMAQIHSPIIHTSSPDDSPFDGVLAALQRYLPSNKDDVVQAEDEDSDYLDVPADEYSYDLFRMYEFKVRRCARARSHEWTECPFAHPGDKARRRDPRKYHYSSSACPDFRKGACKRGDACEYAHGVFECWLHPARYRTQPCKDGTHCRRRVCFFAHTPEQLRVLPEASPRGPSHGSFVGIGTSPRSTVYFPPSSPTTSSPPVSPGGSVPLIQLTESMRGLQINKMTMGLEMGILNPLDEEDNPAKLHGVTDGARHVVRPSLSEFGCMDLLDELEQPARHAAHQLVLNQQRESARLIADLMHKDETFFGALSRLELEGRSSIPFRNAGRILGDLRNCPNIGRECRDYFIHIYENPF